MFVAVITNALDIMEDRGRLILNTGLEGEGIAIRITDTGSGISPEHISRTFDPFFTTKGRKGGTGLGLAIARKIVSSHNGSIDLVSEEGNGATVMIALPL